MAGARDEILGRIRQALKRGTLAEAKAGELRERLSAPRRNLVPARATALDDAGRAALFIAMVEEVQATVARVAALDGVPGAVAEYLARMNLPTRFVVAPDPALDAIPWQDRPLLEPHRGRAEDGDAVGVTACFAGVAETGTLMLLSGPESPTRNNFLPDTDIVVLRASQIVASYEDGWARLRQRQRRADGDWAMPRTVNFITGPSRTADIAQQIELGAHGPRRLHIVLIDDKEAAPGEASDGGARA